METLLFSDLDENLFQGILIVSCTSRQSAQGWLQQIIENAKDNPNLEFQPVLKDGVKLLTFDVDSFRSLAPIHCHSALLDNKYYTTQIYLVAQEDILYFPERFYDFFHGVLIYFDNNIEDGLKAVEKWIPYTDMMENCAIKILACDTATDHTPISRIDIQNYCIDKGFELVELHPLIEESLQDDLEDDFKESSSYERLYQAIQAYVWPNLNYKQKGTDIAAYISRTRAPDDLIEEMSQVKLDDSNTLKPQNALLTPKSAVQSTKANEATSGENVTEEQVDKFENIFYRFTDIKETAAKLEDKDRRDYAGKVAMAFLASLSDDKDDISGFSSEEEAEPNHVYI